MKQRCFGESGVPFFDVNTLEIWTQGYIPGAKFFNVRNWKDLLPKDKGKTIVFYCVNRLCTASEMAAKRSDEAWLYRRPPDA